MARKKQLSSGLYSVHPMIPYAQAVINNMPEKTGRSLEEWVALTIADGPEGEKERRAWLKKEHKVGGTTAMMISERSVGKGKEMTDPDEYLRAAEEYVEAMYSAKVNLRPIHDALIDRARALGEVRICPCKTIVPLYREHVSAEIKPATIKRIDLGLALRNHKGRKGKRLIVTAGLEKGNRITHRIPLSALEEVDEEVSRWLQLAYNLAEPD